MTEWPNPILLIELTSICSAGTTFEYRIFSDLLGVFLKTVEQFNSVVATDQTKFLKNRKRYAGQSLPL